MLFPMKSCFAEILFLHNYHSHQSYITVCLHTHFAAVFSQLFSHCRRLQVVSLKCCALLDNAAVCSLAHHCPSLLFLSVAGCYLVSDRSLLAIATKCKHLTVLDVANTKVHLVKCIFVGYLAIAYGI